MDLVKKSNSSFSYRLFEIAFIENKTNTMYLLTYWLEVRAHGPRAKYFPVQPDLAQSIGILSYDHLLLNILKILPEPK